jgi:hypothetical protein
MSDLIVRVYETEQQAKGVVKKLKDAGFADDAIVQLAPEPAAGEEGAPKKSRPVGAGQLADFYAEQLQQGRSLVGVRAAFGEGRRATNILESGNPLAVELPQLSCPRRPRPPRSGPRPLPEPMISAMRHRCRGR